MGRCSGWYRQLNLHACTLGGLSNSALPSINLCCSSRVCIWVSKSSSVQRSSFQFLTSILGVEVNHAVGGFVRGFDARVWRSILCSDCIKYPTFTDQLGCHDHLNHVTNLIGDIAGCAFAVAGNADQFGLCQGLRNGLRDLWQLFNLAVFQVISLPLIKLWVLVVVLILLKKQRGL